MCRGGQAGGERPPACDDPGGAHPAGTRLGRSGGTFALADTVAPPVSASSQLLDEAESIARLLEKESIPVLLIGAGAMAVHHYVRFTRDLDLAVAISTQALERLAGKLRSQGLRVEYNPPDPDDPLDGMVDVVTGSGLVQIVNFGGTFPSVISDALDASPAPVREGSPLLVMPLFHLIVLKLYAGGAKSRIDIIELLQKNGDLDRKALEALCRRYRLRGMKAILREADTA